MARVVLAQSLKQFTDGRTELDIDAANIRQLFRALGERYPAMKPHLEEGFAVAIDGTIYQDAWLQPIALESEVYIIPQIGGG